MGNTTIPTETSNCGPDAKPDLDTFWPVDVVALNQEFASIVVYRRESVPSSSIIYINREVLCFTQGKFICTTKQ